MPRLASAGTSSRAHRAALVGPSKTANMPSPAWFTLLTAERRQLALDDLVVGIELVPPALVPLRG